MRGCHFQDRPCRASICLRPLHLWRTEGLMAPVFRMCDQGAAERCPHRAWDHGTHVEVCRSRSLAVDHCPSCGGRHALMAEALRCEIARSVQGGPSPTAMADQGINGWWWGAHLPDSMRPLSWRMARKAAVERDGGRCRGCGKDLAAVPSWLTEVHHLVPRREGGGDHPSNLVTLCVMCHKRETERLRPPNPPSNREEWLPRDVLSAFE